MDIRETVQERYGKIAAGVSDGHAQKPSCCSPPSSTQSATSSCCGSSPSASACNELQITDISINYEGLELSALPKEAVEASLGCANPIVFAQLQDGETVLDLGSGGGIDVLLASRFVGENGKVFGLDMTDEMLHLANANKERMGATNVEFIKGYIEDIPLPDESVDVVLSNCVINLAEDKKVALAEAYRVIKDGGRLRVADVVATKEVAPELRKSAELWCGCLAGTITVEEYKRILLECGFKDINIEIIHTYTKEIIMAEFASAFESGLPDVKLNDLDGAFAGALISADK